MQYKVLKNVLSQEQIESILDFYNEYRHLIEQQENGWEKLNSPWSFDTIKSLDSVISQHIDTSNNLGDNIYKHTFPYFPHVDTHGGYPCVNVLVPLYVDKPQKFIIFDQYVKEYTPRTYMGDIKLDKDFKTNTSTTFISEDTDVVGLTNKPIDQKFYNDNLKHEYRTEKMFYGCTGHAVDFTPGDIIIFDSKFIHCTGSMLADYKIGLSLRFSGEYV
tara:strand:+ start:484 stop:1134 length:651 start_codon:yes stop_codon:yes gene_type:complete